VIAAEHSFVAPQTGQRSSRCGWTGRESVF
jgi:hypothetical protein